MSVLPKAIYRFKSTPIKIPIVYFSSIFGEEILQIYMEPKKTPNSLSNLEKEVQRKRDDIKLYYKAIVIKTAWY